MSNTLCIFECGSPFIFIQLFAHLGTGILLSPYDITGKFSIHQFPSSQSSIHHKGKEKPRCHTDTVKNSLPSPSHTLCSLPGLTYMHFRCYAPPTLQTCHIHRYGPQYNKETKLKQETKNYIMALTITFLFIFHPTAFIMYMYYKLFSFITCSTHNKQARNTLKYLRLNI